VKVIAATAVEAAHVLDGLLGTAAGRRVRVHHTDGGGVSDHVFGLCTLLGYDFIPRIPNLDDRRLYAFEPRARYGRLAPLLGERLDTDLIRDQWGELRRLAASLRAGTVPASLILRRLGVHPRQNALAAGLREVGRAARTLFTLRWIADPELRRIANAELNKMVYPGRPCWTCLRSSLTLGRGAYAAHQLGDAHALRGSRRVDAADGGLRARRYGQGRARGVGRDRAGCNRHRASGDRNAVAAAIVEP
jgi:hypothetical protein